MTAQGAIKGFFAVILALVYVLGAYAVLKSAMTMPGFTPNSGQLALMDTGGGGLIAFIAAQLGITVTLVNVSGLRNRVNVGMGLPSDKYLGLILLVIDVLVFVGVGIVFLFLFANPDRIAVPEDSKKLTEAPAYIATHARAFLAVVVTASAALAASTRN